MLPAMMDMNSPSETIRKLPIKCFLLLVIVVMMSLHGNSIVTKTETYRHLQRMGTAMRKEKQSIRMLGHAKGTGREARRNLLLETVWGSIA